MSTSSINTSQHQHKIEIEDIYQNYPANGQMQDVLYHINLQIRDGEFFCILGPSGCGKSTLLNIMGGFSEPTAGRVMIDGIEHTQPDARYVMMDQEYGLFPWKTVLGNVKFGLELMGRSKEEQEVKAREFIRLVHLEDYEDRRPFELSGGMKQRVALARTLAVDPQIIFMDEPFNALDMVMRSGLQDELVRLWHQRHQTIVFVTHDIEEAIYLGDRVAIMKNKPGVIDTVIEVALARPRDRGSKEFFALKNDIMQVINR